MNGDLLTIIEQIVSQKELPQSVLINAVEAAIRSAAKKRYGSIRAVSVAIDRDTGAIKVYAPKKVVEIMRHYATEIPIEEASKIKPEAQLGEVIEVEVEPGEFGRIEAQTARQIFVQKIKEAEREMVYEEYKDRVGDIVRGTVQRREQDDIILELGKTEAILPLQEQVEKEEYKRGDELQCFIMEVRNVSKVPVIILSRTHPGLIARLFELEVPEIYDGLIRIMAIARDPGDRSKIAVATTDENIDAVGTCVGMKGSRVQMVVNELGGEKIDILEWNPDPEIFIGNALQPAKVSKVTIINRNENKAEVIVPDDQLSLAIGRKGQNVRLAAKLTGWRIDIKNESEADSELKQQITKEIFKSELRESETGVESDSDLSKRSEIDENHIESENGFTNVNHDDIESLPITELSGVGEKTAQKLREKAYSTIASIARATIEELAAVPGIGVAMAKKIHKSAIELMRDE
ncbi:transcription termination/antitermination protein NusA [Candidatus Poribacteria bacterium]|nr:transcription termination/antitermination protein NusA [Candidatus Poribacteria bacterium]